MAFSRRYPQVELKILELGTHKMMEAMLNGEVETAAVMLPSTMNCLTYTFFRQID